VKGIISLLDSNVAGPINIGSIEECTMLQLANVVLGATKSKAGIVFKPKPEDDPSQRKPDISKASSLLGWKPTVDLSMGIKMTVSWFRDNE
jgi:nucleoside-diphosphate-sugar epimerase